MYPFNSTEQAIEQRYNALGLTAPIHPSDLARATGVTVKIADAEPAGNPKTRRIVLDRRSDRLTRREDFAHELAHILMHSGSQWFSADTWIDLQEREAERLALYLLIPTHLLLPFLQSLSPRTENEAIGAIAQNFIVSVEFARKRFKKLRAQIEGHLRQQQLEQVLESIPQYGRDYDSCLSIGGTEYFYRGGGVVFHRRAMEN